MRCRLAHLFLVIAPSPSSRGGVASFERRCCLFWALLLPLLGVAVASFGRRCCLFWVSLLPLLGIAVASFGHRCCLFWASLLPLLDVALLLPFFEPNIM